MRVLEKSSPPAVPQGYTHDRIPQPLPTLIFGTQCVRYFIMVALGLCRGADGNSLLASSHVGARLVSFWLNCAAKSCVLINGGGVHSQHTKPVCQPAEIKRLSRSHPVHMATVSRSSYQPVARGMSLVVERFSLGQSFRDAFLPGIAHCDQQCSLPVRFRLWGGEHAREQFVVVARCSRSCCAVLAARQDGRAVAHMRR